MFNLLHKHYRPPEQATTHIFGIQQICSRVCGFIYPYISHNAPPINIAPFIDYCIELALFGVSHYDYEPEDIIHPIALLVNCGLPREYINQVIDVVDKDIRLGIMTILDIPKSNKATNSQLVRTTLYVEIVPNVIKR